MVDFFRWVLFMVIALTLLAAGYAAFNEITVIPSLLFVLVLIVIYATTYLVEIAGYLHGLDKRDAARFEVQKRRMEQQK